MNSTGYSKMAQNAIAAMSYLAERYGAGGGAPLLRSAEIAEARGLSQTLVAKILTILSQAGLVEGVPGPNGGYRLQSEPGKVSFFDVVRLFDRVNETFPCPFGADYCPNEKPCPVHDEMVAMRETLDAFLKQAHFGKFLERHSI